MKISGIYQIQSKIKPERIYIGSACSIQRRWIEHLSMLRNNKHGSKKLQNHYNKYGVSDLDFSIIIGCDKEDLLKVEQYFLDAQKPWFNNSIIAGSPMLGKNHSDETKRKMSLIHKGSKRTEETKKKMSDWQKGENNHQFGKHKTEEQKAIVRAKLIGRKVGPMSEEQKIKLSQSKKGQVPWNKGKTGVQTAWNKGLKYKQFKKEHHEN